MTRKVPIASLATTPFPQYTLLEDMQQFSVGMVQNGLHIRASILINTILIQALFSKTYSAEAGYRRITNVKPSADFLKGTVLHIVQLHDLRIIGRILAQRLYENIGNKNGSSRKVRETNREEPNEHKEETVISVAISKALGNFNLVIESLKFTC